MCRCLATFKTTKLHHSLKGCGIADGQCKKLYCCWLGFQDWIFGETLKNEAF